MKQRLRRRAFLFFFIFAGLGFSQASAQEFGLGMIMDDESYESIPLAPVLMRGDYDQIPSSYSLRDYAPYPGNQGRTGTCVGWATGYAARTIVAALENGWTDRDYITDHAYSPSFVYNSLKKRYAGSGPDPMCTKGAMVEHAMQLLRDDGVAPLSDFPFDCEIEIQDDDLDVADDHRIVEYQRVFVINAVDKIKNVRKAISEGKPVVIGMNVPTSFLNAVGKEHWEPKEDEQAEGGHAMAVIGYDDEKFGGSFEVMNSWGSRWGKDGFIWIPYEHFAKYVRYGFAVFVGDRPDPDKPDLAGSIGLLLASGDTMRTVFEDGEFRVDRPYQSGTQFRILLTNEEPAYLYAVATDLTRKITRLIPLDDSYSALLTSKNSHIALPSGDEVIVMDDRPGIDYLGVLYSKQELDLDSLISEMHRLPGSLYERLNAALGDAVIPQSDISFDADGRLAFEAKSEGGYIVPMVVAIEHEAPVAAVDRTAPQIALLSPKPVVTGMRGLTVKKQFSTNLEVLGTAYDLGGIDTVRVNGVAAAIEADGTTFRASLPNSDTLSVLHVYATDRAGNEAQEHFVIALRKQDRLPPDITLSAPMVQRDAVAGIELVADTLAVSGSVDDRGEVVAVYVNGIKADLGYGGAFSVDVPIVDGSTEITVKAHDAAGNMASEKWYVADEDLVARRAAAAANEEAFVLFDVFYATDRAPTGRTSPRSFYGGKPGDLTHGVAEVSIPKTHQVGELESPTWWRLDATPDPSRHIMLQSLKPMDEATLIKEMRAEIEKSTGKSAFVYVHGYNTEFDEAARRTAQMAYDLNFDGIAAMYSWPSDGTLLGYASDEIDVERAVKYLKRYLELIVEDSGADQVHLLAHSMGNRALTQALMSIAEEQAEPVFTEIILAAPDIDADLFRNEIAPVIQQTADRVTLYASANDKALIMSEKLHGGRRVGDSSGGIVIIDGIETVDVSGVDTALLGLGHSYFAQTRAVLSDMVKVVGMRMPADQRELIPRIVAELRYWALGTE